MARAVEQGFGLSVDVNDAAGLSQNLRRALQHVLGHPGFAGNATRVSRLIRSTRWTPASQAASESLALQTLGLPIAVHVRTVIVEIIFDGQNTCMSITMS